MTKGLNFEVVSLPGGIITEEDIFVEMRDGLKMCLNVYRPEKPGKFPVIISFTPYGKDVSPQQYIKRFTAMAQARINIGKIHVSQATSFEAPDPAFWVSNDYVVIYVDVRGYNKSEGEKGSLRIWSRAEVDDYYDLIEWAGNQKWSNGNVGLSGVSYLAISQYFAAVSNPPHLKAINPWEGVSDQYRDTCFPGGIPETTFHVRWETGNLKKMFDESALASFLDPVVNQSMLQQAAPQLEKINVPALICATWSDQALHSRGGFEAFRRISSKDEWLYTHGRRKWEEYYSDEALKYQKKFFDYFLKGIENGMMDTPRVRLEVRETLNKYEVRNENEWPIARTEYKKMYLDSGTGTLNSNGISQVGKVGYESLWGRVLFELIFDQDTELTGHMKLKLWVSAEGADDMDLFVGVEKLDANGNEVHFHGTEGYVRGIVAMGWLRVSQREQDENRSTPWQPFLKHRGEQKLKPGEIVPVEIEIRPSSTLFRKGETLRLGIGGKDMVSHPRFTYTRLVNRGMHLIYTGGVYDSHLLIPVIPPKSQ